METSETAIVSTTPDFDVVEPITAEQIVKAHTDASSEAFKLVNMASTWISRAAHCGKLLIAKKQELGHGNWLPWLAENITAFGYDTANDYMKAARYLEKYPNLDGKPLNTVWVQNLRQAAAMLEDKPSSHKEEHEKPAFMIRCRFNIEPEKLDEHQRKDWCEQMRPYFQIGEAFGFIEIKA